MKILRFNLNMPSRLFRFLLFFLLSFPGISCGTWDVGRTYAFDAATRAELQQAVLESMIIADEIEVPGVISGIWTPDRGSWVQAFGYSDISSGRPMKTTDSFRIGSVTKAFTATVILQLLDEGRLALDDTMAFFGFPNIPNAGLVTVRHLLNMTSGFFCYTQDDAFVKELIDNPTRKWTPRELLDIGFSRSVNFQPGEEYEYSNTNYILLGVIIEIITGSAYESEVNTRIIEPLSLNNTGYPSTPYTGDEFSRGYTWRQDNYTDVTAIDPSCAWAAGGIVSDVRDMKKWAVALGAGSLLKPGTQLIRSNWDDSLSGDPYFKYCLGGYWMGENILFGHSGTIPGFSSSVFYMPGRGAAFVIMGNVDFLDTDRLTMKLSRIVYPVDAGPFPPDNLKFAPWMSSFMSSGRIEWAPAGSESVAAYNVYASTGPEGSGACAGAGGAESLKFRLLSQESSDATGYTHTGITGNLKYYYAVTSVDEEGIESRISSRILWRVAGTGEYGDMYGISWGPERIID